MYSFTFSFNCAGQTAKFVQFGLREVLPHAQLNLKNIDQFSL
jgi:hypothetical protein